MDFSMIRSTLLEEINNDPEAELLDCTDTDITIFDSNFGKDILFRVAPHTPDSLRDMIHFGASLRGKGARSQIDKIAEVLLALDPCVLLTLRHIFVIRTVEDAIGICNDLDLDEEMLPEALLDEDGNLDNGLIGVSWFYESAVIINVSAIEQTAEELCGSRRTSDYRHEVQIGFWTTLLHEIRHNQVDCCPYELPWLHTGDESEESVEEWGLRTFEDLHIC